MEGGEMGGNLSLYGESTKDAYFNGTTLKKGQPGERGIAIGRAVGIITCFVALYFMSACGRIVKNPTQITDMGVQPRPYSQQEYYIQPGDVLDVKFFYNRELNELLTVRPDGRISMQLAHEVMAAGKTPAQLTKTLEFYYKKELENPEITVIVRSFSAQKVYVGGEVNRPGAIVITSPITVLQAIFAAGGLKDTALISQVIVIRRVSPNKPLTIPVNLKKAIDGTDTNQDITLMPDDVVYVPF
jgi:protein involved in polysaccharide export with SLBB domain